MNAAKSPKRKTVAAAATPRIVANDGSNVDRPAMMATIYVRGPAKALAPSELTVAINA